MAKLKKDQKVRIVGTLYHPENLGREAVVVREEQYDSDLNMVLVEIIIKDRPPPPGFSYWRAKPEQLEPILDKPVSWEAVEEITDGWNPAKVRVAV